jgi:hypothetical protein
VSESLRAALRRQGGALAELAERPAHDRSGQPPARHPASPEGAAPEPSGYEPGPPQLAARGPRAAGREAEYELLLEMILEGSRLHYGRPRVVAPADDDLALLLGDQLYALGLARLAALGDVEAVAELADVISLVAQAHAASDAALAEAVWEAGAVAIGWGASPDHDAAKGLARAEDPRATGLLRAVAARCS